MLLDEIYFLARYTPFWAIPVFLIGGEFCYIFWTRKKMKLAFFSGFLSLTSFICAIGYYVAGGPEKTVDKLMHFIWYFFY